MRRGRDRAMAAERQVETVIRLRRIPKAHNSSARRCYFLPPPASGEAGWEAGTVCD